MLNARSIMRWMPMMLVIALVLTSTSCGNKQVNQDKARLHYDIAWDLLRKGEQANAIEQLQKAIEFDPDNPEIRNLMGLVFASRNLFEQAESEYFKALSLKPKYPEVHNNLCGLYISQSLWDRAIDQCKKAISYITYASPERAYHNLGWAYYKKGDLVKAIDAYSQALKHRPGFYLAHQNLGIAYFDMGKYNLAVDNYKKAIDGCNFCPEPYYRLGLTLFKINKRTIALKSFKKCIELAKDQEIGELCDNFVKKYKR